MNKLFKTGNGHQHENHKKAMHWFIENFDRAKLINNKQIRIEEKIYHVTYSAEQKNIMLVGTQHGDSTELPAFLKDVDGTLVLRQLKNGRLAGHQFDGRDKLWNAKDGMVSISWDKAGPLTDQVVVKLPE